MGLWAAGCICLQDWIIVELSKCKVRVCYLLELLVSVSILDPVWLSCKWSEYLSFKVIACQTLTNHNWL